MTDPAPLQLARALLPDIAAAAAQTERDRRIAGPLLERLLAARLFRLLLPRALDGEELAPIPFLQVLETVAQADASTAWCIAQTSVCAMAASRLPLAVGREIFGSERAILAWGFGPPGQAIPEPGGWRISGRWSFGSGAHHATWLGGICAAAGETPRMMLFPGASAVFDEGWEVIGLRGTGSDGYAVDGVFVPEAFSFRFASAPQPHAPAALYRLPFDSFWGCGFAAVALGVARAMLDALVALAREKTPRGLTQTLAAMSATQSLLAGADASLRAARGFLHQALEHAWQLVERSGGADLAARMTIRQAASHALRVAREVAESTYHAAGANAVFAANPFERRLRDMHMISQHVHARPQHFEVVGQFMLGLSPEAVFL